MVERINNAACQVLNHLDQLHAMDIDCPIVVCTATEDQWNAYVESEYQAVPSRLLMWNPATFEAVISELPRWPHERFREELGRVIRAPRAVSSALVGYDAAHNMTGPKYEPDLSFGPKAIVVKRLGAIPPPNGTPWGDYITLRVEVGVAQTWGCDFGQLDHQALAVWALQPCIAYVLCIQVSNDLTTGSYKLYVVNRHNNGRRQQLEFQPLPTPIAAPATVIRFNSRRLLGLPDNAVLPDGFPDPELKVDLH